MVHVFGEVHGAKNVAGVDRHDGIGVVEVGMDGERVVLVYGGDERVDASRLLLVDDWKSLAGTSHARLLSIGPFVDYRANAIGLIGPALHDLFR